LGWYGGTDPHDNSGVIQYCRIEFAGVAYVPNSETNGLTLGGVGDGTIIDHVQVSFGGDDSFEFFGGTVNVKYLVTYRSLDDEFDTDYGYSGHLQFCVSLRDSSLADVSGSNGFESDNDANGSSNTPTTRPIISNFTIVGPKRTLGTTVHSNYKRGAHLRRGTSECIYNSLIMGYPTGLQVENTSTFDNCTNDLLQWRNNIIAGCPAAMDNLTATNLTTWYNDGGNSTLANVSDLMLANPYHWTAPDFQPQQGSPALTGADFSATNLQKSFFTQTAYRGAFDGTHDWTAGWTNWDPENTPYLTVPITGVQPSLVATIGSLGIHPNPSSSGVTLSLDLVRSDLVEITLVNPAGQVVMHESLRLHAGSNQVALNVSGLNQGMYLAQVKASDGNHALRLAVMH
jgi:hypothetical protein